MVVSCHYQCCYEPSSIYLAPSYCSKSKSSIELLVRAQATRFAARRKNFNCFEINGKKGSIEFSLERLNELRLHNLEEFNKDIIGWHETLVTESRHPRARYKCNAIMDAMVESAEKGKRATEQ